MVPLDAMLAGAAMALLSAFVLGNSLRLRSFRSQAVERQSSAPGHTTCPAEPVGA